MSAAKPAKPFADFNAALDVHLRMDSEGGCCSVTRTRTGAWIVRGGLFPRRRYRTYRQALLEHARRVAPRVAAAMRAGASCLAAGDLT